MNPKLGYYKVGAKTFYNKLQALIYASPTEADVTWHFNNEVLDNVDWKTEPPGTLDFWYSERAKQIREEFDYVILMCSGGADSTNMLNSFLSSGCKVDEIVAGAPLSGLKNWKVNKNDKSAKNIISETFLAQLPLMESISKTHPEIKITIHDYFEDILKMKTDEWIYELSGHWIHYSATARHSLEKFSHLKNLAESGKKIAVVYGIDKPIIYRGRWGHLFSLFYDTAVNIITPHFKERYPNVESVLFYYTPDMPQLLVKQAHELCKQIYRPENLRISSLIMDYYTDITKMERDPMLRASEWQRSISPYIYPSIQDHIRNTWQADKQGAGFESSFDPDQWIYTLNNVEGVTQMVESDMKLFLSRVNKKYCVSIGGDNGFVRFNQHWLLGHESKFLPKGN